METIWLQRPTGDIPWGFRLQGGLDCGAPLSVQRVSASFFIITIEIPSTKIIYESLSYYMPVVA